MEKSKTCSKVEKNSKFPCTHSPSSTISTNCSVRTLIQFMIQQEVQIPISPNVIKNYEYFMSNNDIIKIIYVYHMYIHIF